MSDAIVTATGDLFATVAGVDSQGGVAMNAPPAAILSEVSDMVTTAMADVPPDAHGQLVGIATEIDGTIAVNLALAVRATTTVEILAWVGKSWGRPIKAGLVTGGAARWTF